jgi:hypothetical protein
MLSTQTLRRPAAVVPRIPDRVDAIALAVALIAGLLVRVHYIMMADFPLNDGGMFYVMTRELMQAHYHLPVFTTYNGAGLPFAYPPLGFYVAGLLSQVTHTPLIDVFRFLPLAVNMAAIVAFYALARTFLHSRLAVGCAVVAFALQPESFGWQIMGGGLTRSFGMLFALLAVRQVYLLYTRAHRRDVPLAALFAGLTVLSHLEAGYFVALSALVLFVLLGRGRGGVARSLAVAALVVLLTAPWWATIISRHGIEPFLAARGTNRFSGLFWTAVTLVIFRGSREAFYPVIAGLSLLGVYSCWLKRQALLPVWLAAVWLLDPRGSHNYVTVPIALLAALAVDQILVRLWRGTDEHTALATMRRAAAPAGVLAVLACYATVSALFTAEATLGALAPEQRAAMAWVANNTDASGQFLVVTGNGWDPIRGYGLGMDAFTNWGIDRTVEWFPALANRVSLDTPQGYEWLPHFDRIEHVYTEAQKCGERDASCLSDWSRETGRSFRYVYIPKAAGREIGVGDAEGCCWALRHALRSDPGYTTVYDGPGASVFERRAPAP